MELCKSVNNNIVSPASSNCRSLRCIKEWLHSLLLSLRDSLNRWAKIESQGKQLLD